MVTDTMIPDNVNGGGGCPKREDAIRFLDRVRTRLEGRPQDYSDFLNIMRDLKSESLNINCAIAKVCHLFQDFPDLIQGFSIFLPPGHRLPTQYLAFFYCARFLAKCV